MGGSCPAFHTGAEEGGRAKERPGRRKKEGRRREREIRREDTVVAKGEERAGDQGRGKRET